jgi:hypothetical protein
VEPAEAAHPVRAAAHPVRAAAHVAAVVAVAVVAAPHAAAAGVVGAAVPDALVVAPVLAVVVAAEPDAAAAGMAEPEAAAAAVAPDAAVAVVGSAAAAAFSPFPFPDLLEALERSQARRQMAWRVLIRAPQPTRSCRPTATLLFWTSANDLLLDSNSCRTKVSQLGHNKLGVSSPRMGQ